LLFSVSCCAQSPDGTLSGQSESEKRLLDRVMIVESGGKQFSKNPLSSALGPFQFVEGTFLEIVRRTKPALTAGKSDPEILRLRTDPEISRDAALIYIRESAKSFAARNVAANAANLRLAFFLGQPIHGLEVSARASSSAGRAARLTPEKPTLSPVLSLPVSLPNRQAQPLKPLRQ
jgi:hypothetical protein